MRVDRNTSGFTLIEVIVALAVIGALMLLFASALPGARKAANINGDYAQAISLCQHKIDQMRAVGFGRLNYTELNDAGIIDDTPVNLPYSFTVVDEVANYLPQPTATINIQSISSKAVKVIVTITWKPTTYQSHTSTISVSALIANVE